MRDLLDLIRYELEGTGVDFKAIQYGRDRHEDLLKDVMAMANADLEGDRYIVFGVKLRPDGQRHFRGIEREEFRDSAEYEQLIHQNIEPELDVEYIPVDLDETLVGVLRIGSCTDPPYLMKKKYGDLAHGDGFVRKGSHQLRLTRQDFDRFRAASEVKHDLSGDLCVSFTEGKDAKGISLPRLKNVLLPSEQAKRRIREILAHRRQLESLGMPYGWRVLQDLQMAFPGQPTPFEQRSTEKLKRDLTEVEETYREEDLYYLLEQSAHRVQLYIGNSGERYAEDVSVRLRIPARDGIIVPDRIHQEPRSADPLGMYRRSWDFEPEAGYPDVNSSDGEFLVFSKVGDVPHGLWTAVYGAELRLVLTPLLGPGLIEMPYEVFGRNLTTAVEGVLEIEVTVSEEE